MLDKIREFWAYLTAPYDEELANASDTVCEACKFGDACCPLCPVTYVKPNEA